MRRLRRRRWQVAIGAAAVLGVAFFLIPVEDGEDDAPPATPTATPTPAPTPLVRFDVPAYDGPRHTIELSGAPQSVEPDRVASLGPKPEPRFPDWDGETVVLYNLETGEARDLGAGRIWLSPFSADSSMFLWMEGTSPVGADLAVKVMDLATGNVTRYAEGARASFGADGTLQVWPSANPLSRPRSFDLETGELVFREPLATPALGNESVVATVHHPGGYRVQSIRGSGAFLPYRSIVIAPDGSAVEFPSAQVVSVLTEQPEVEVLVLTAQGAHNLYRVSLADRRPRLVGAVGDARTLGRPVLEAMAAGQGYIAWTQHLCSQDEGRTFVYEIGADRLTEIDEALPLVPSYSEHLAVGAPPGVHALIDIETLEYVDVMPGSPSRSVDGRWAVNAPVATFGPNPVVPAVDACPPGGGVLAGSG